MKKFKKEGNLLCKTRCYLVGHMQYVNGRDWRDMTTKRFNKMNITCFNPYEKPFVKDVEEDEARRAEMLEMMRNSAVENV